MDRIQLLQLFEGLRVADVRDGLDFLGWHAGCTLAPEIRPLYRTRAYGIARTARYLPYQGRVPELSPHEYLAWSGQYYGTICTYPWVEHIREGDLIAIDQSSVNAGLMGSENTLACLARGARGFVSNGGVRDTDEIILQQIPFWSAFVSQGMVQGRLEFESTGEAICVGGVTIREGDVIVADGDGVICVPRTVAGEVARLAREENARDRLNRKRHYEALGRELDETVG